MSNTELQEYKAKVLDVARQVKAENEWCDDGYRAVLRELGLDELDMEPSRGSVVVDPGRSVAFVRQWGGGMWTKTGEHPRYTWNQVLTDVAPRKPFVLLNANERDDYRTLSGYEGIVL